MYIPYVLTKNITPPIMWRYSNELECNRNPLSHICSHPPTTAIYTTKDVKGANPKLWHICPYLL